MHSDISRHLWSLSVRYQQQSPVVTNKKFQMSTEGKITLQLSAMVYSPATQKGHVADDWLLIIQSVI